MARPKPTREQIIQRFISNIEFTDYCWNYTKPKGHVYPRININGKIYYCHHFSYRLWNGKRYKGCDIHHICENKRCVNPDHLEQIPKNVHRYLTQGWTLISGVWFCKRGHELLGWNAIPNGSGIACRECQYGRWRTHYRHRR